MDSIIPTKLANPLMNKSINPFFSQSSRRSHGGRAPCSSISVTSTSESTNQQEPERTERRQNRDWLQSKPCAQLLSTAVSPNTTKAKRRSKRGGKNRKRRAGARKTQWKCERLAKVHLRMMYWNCRSLDQRGPVAEKLAYSVDVICLQETQHGRAKNFKPAGYSLLYNSQGHGQTMLMRNEITYRELDVNRWTSEKLHLQGVELENQPVKNIINVYACNNSLTQADWLKLEDLRASLSGTTVLCGDFNARGRQWGNTVCNPQGEALEDALDQSDLICANDGRNTRLASRPGDSDSVIDLALMSPELEGKYKWDVLEDHGSDHLPCTLFIKRTKPVSTVKRRSAFRYNLDSTDVITTLRRQARQSGRKRSKILQQPPWWNPDVEETWKAKRVATRRYRNDESNTRLKDLSKEAEQNFKSFAEETKNDRYETFCREVTADRALHKFWNFRRAMNRQKSSYTICDFQLEEGTWARTEVGKGEALFERYLAQTDQKNEEERHNLLSAIHTSLADETTDVTISSDTLKKVLASTADTAPGPDGVRYSNMKAMEGYAQDSLAHTLDNSLQESKIPEDWLHSHLAAIPKPDKDPTKIASYRIITMQNTVGKLLERFIARKLASILENENLLPPALGSYRPRKDTWANAAILAQDVYENFEKGNETMVAALDLEDAYNRVQYDVVMRTLVNLKIDAKIIMWIGTALLKRRVSLRLGSYASEPRIITPGLPQGSPLSPVIFNIYTIGVTSNQLEAPGRTLSFADDILVYRHGKDRAAVATSLQVELNRVGEWCNDNNGKLHPGKAGILWCSLNNHAVQAEMPTVSINNTVINRVETLKYLGITFNRTLSGKEHIEKTVDKARKGLTAMKVMAAASMPQRILILLYQSLVLSVVEYGLGLLTLPKYAIARLETIQNQGMRVILGCTRDTSGVAMRYVLDFPTMNTRHKLAQVKAYLRVTADEQHLLHHKIGRLGQSRLARGTSWMLQAENTLSKCCNIEDIRRGREWIPVDDDLRPYSKVIANLGRQCREWPEHATELEIQSTIDENSRPGDVVIYTDGSVVRGRKSGWGFFAQANNEVANHDSGAFECTTSSMCMEVHAISEALKWLEKCRYTHAVFITDSMSTLEKIKRGSMYVDWARSIQKSKLKKITWVFCPGHAGVSGNERADRLAGDAAVRGRMTIDPKTVLAFVRDSLQTERDDEENSTTMWILRNKDVLRGAALDSDLRGRERRLANQMTMETVSLWTLKWTLQRRDEQIWTCAHCDDSSS